MAEDPSTYTKVGRIAGVFGVKGWLKIQSSTEPHENIFEYSPWWIKSKAGWQKLQIDQFQAHKGAWIAHVQGLDDRTEAEALKLLDIHVDRSLFKDLDDGDFYWHQLIGMRVVASQANTIARDLGVVREIMETGANDVLVVEADAKSFDGKERLIPYVPDAYIKKIDLDAGTILADWHIDD